MGEKTIAFALFPGVTLLDLVGPLQVLKSLPPPWKTVVVGRSTSSIASDSGLPCAAACTFADAPDPAVVIVPGGPGSVRAMADEVIQAYLRSSAETAEVVASVCTGALVLAAGGMLDGRRATTHWAYARELELLGARYVRARWVEDGRFITAAGVSAGIDLALALAARLTDEATARAIQLSIEYDPEPPFGRIDWTRVGEAERIRQRRGGTGAQLEKAGELLAGRPELLRKLSGSR